MLGTGLGVNGHHGFVIRGGRELALERLAGGDAHVCESGWVGEKVPDLGREIVRVAGTEVQTGAAIIDDHGYLVAGGETVGLLRSGATAHSGNHAGPSQRRPRLPPAGLELSPSCPLAHFPSSGSYWTVLTHSATKTRYGLNSSEVTRPKGRDFGAWLGLVPKQISTGDRTILGKISRQGNRYLHVLFVQAARVVLMTWRSPGIRQRRRNRARIAVSWHAAFVSGLTTEKVPFIVAGSAPTRVTAVQAMS